MEPRETPGSGVRIVNHCDIQLSITIEIGDYGTYERLARHSDYGRSCEVSGSVAKHYDKVTITHHYEIELTIVIQIRSLEAVGAASIWTSSESKTACTV